MKYLSTTNFRRLGHCHSLCRRQQPHCHAGPPFRVPCCLRCSGRGQAVSGTAHGAGEDDSGRGRAVLQGADPWQHARAPCCQGRVARVSGLCAVANGGSNNGSTYGCHIRAQRCTYRPCSKGTAVVAGRRSCPDLCQSHAVLAERWGFFAAFVEQNCLKFLHSSFDYCAFLSLLSSFS